MSRTQKIRQKGIVPVGRIPVPQKPPKAMPHGKDYKRKPKHRKPIPEERD
ncbi:MAG: hypothetical protein Q8O51_01555 [bacterium]|nr:hypothetical protein [bacterium]